MSIGSIFNMARTAMNAQQTAVQIASQNISNAETDGYSRQRVDLAASTPTVFPWGSIGTGVTIAGVSRARDALLDATFRGDSASASAAQTTSDALSQIQGIFGEPSDNGLGASLDAFWSAWGDLANDPTNSAAKSVVRQTGSTVASTLNRFARQLDSLDQSNREGMNADVTQINLREGRCESIALDGVDTPVQRLVVAAGIGSKALTMQLGMKIPLEAERGYHVTIKNPGVLPNRQIIVKDWGMGAGPIDGDLRVAGTVEFSGLKAKPDWKRADRLLLRAKELFPSVNAGEFSRWKGDRPSISDGLAVLGKPKRFENIYFAFGNGQHGMSAGPMMGKVLSEIVLGRKTSIDPSPFNPDRFS